MLYSETVPVQTFIMFRLTTSHLQIESLQKNTEEKRDKEDVENFAFDYFFEQTRAAQKSKEETPRIDPLKVKPTERLEGDWI